MTNTKQATSLRDRLAARREHLQQERIFELPVPGYEADLIAKYRALGYREQREIGVRNDKANLKPADTELNVMADILQAACVDLLERDGESLGQQWGTTAAREVFGAELPPDATQRSAMFAIFPDTALLARHYLDYVEHSGNVQDDVDQVIQGESEARSDRA